MLGSAALVPNTLATKTAKRAPNADQKTCDLTMKIEMVLRKPVRIASRGNTRVVSFCGPAKMVDNVLFDHFP